MGAYFNIIKKWMSVVGETNLEVYQVWKYLSEESHNLLKKESQNQPKKEYRNWVFINIILFIGAMRNIKISFHHRSHIYKFKVDLNVADNSNMFSIDPRKINEAFAHQTQ